jgi:hypothetical protein
MSRDAVLLSRADDPGAVGDRNMPRRNRVTPFGEIVAIPERGNLMGNRGILHDAEGRIRRPWQVKRWLICVLEFRGRYRTVMTPNRYTELFFLDEATALAVGHRPCAECQHRRYLAFRDAWAFGNSSLVGSAAVGAGVIDDRLHADRVGPDRSKRTQRAKIDHLPDGVFVTLGGHDGDAWLIRGDAILAWSPAGYRERRRRPEGEFVKVLTPASTVNAIRSGFFPGIHPSGAVP